MSRHDDWQNRLSDLIETNRDKPFDFVAHNCLLWAGLGIAALTNHNPTADLIGQYKDEKSALRHLKKVEKVASVEEFLAKKLEQEPRAVAFARHGDIVFADAASGAGLLIPCGDMFGKVPGICYGASSYFVGLSGLVSIETLRLDFALWVS